MAQTATEPLELIVLVGIQASGKTTFYRRHLQDRYLHVSLDNWRGKDNVRAKEHRAILEDLRQAAESGVLRGVVVDNTNTTARTRQRYFDCARESSQALGRPVRAVCYFFDATLAECLRRNEERPKDAPAGSPYFVPPGAIAAFQERLQAPSHAEGFERIFRVRIGEDGAFRVEEHPLPRM